MVRLLAADLGFVSLTEGLLRKSAFNLEENHVFELGSELKETRTSFKGIEWTH